MKLEGPLSSGFRGSPSWSQGKDLPELDLSTRSVGGSILPKPSTSAVVTFLGAWVGSCFLERGGMEMALMNPMKPGQIIQKSIATHQKTFQASHGTP